MADEQIRVVYDVTERGMTQVKRLVDDIRKGLGDSGVDMGRFESRLDAIERSVGKVSKTMRTASNTAKSATDGIKGWNESLATVWKRQYTEAQKAFKAIAELDRQASQRALSNNLSGLPANTSAPRVGASFGNIVNQDLKAAEQGSRAYQNLSTSIDGAIKARKSASQAFSDGLKSRMQDEAKAADEESKALSRLHAEQERLLASASKSADRGIGTADKFLAGQAASGRSAARKADIADWDRQFQDATRSANEFKRAQDGIITTRYALYEVAAVYGTIGAAMAGAATYATVVGAQFESAFTNVERTLQGGTLPAEVDEIRSSLVRLSGQIPLTFAQLSEIATIGNQMGIAKEDIVDFTGTIARFSSVSGMSIDEVTKAFGGFMAQTGLAPEYLENLGASIAKVGIDSNAAENEIVSLMREITAGAQQAGFTADAIVGLSGTLAGLQIAPERARGSLSTYFNTLNMAVAEGGDKLELFAQIVGVTSSELERMVRQGDGAEILRRFVGSLNDFNNVDTTRALDALGLAQLRVLDTFIRLSNRLEIYDRDQRNANESFMQGAELQRQYAMTVDDLASQWVIFTNNLNAMIEAVTGGAVPGLAALFSVVNNVISAVTEWLGNNRFVAGVIAFSVATAGALGVLLLFRAASLGATASLLALRVVTRQAGADAIGAAHGFRGLIGTLLGVGNASRNAAGGVFTLRSAIRGLMASSGIGLLVTLGGTLLDGFIGQGDAAEDASLSMDEYNRAVATAGKSMGGTAGAGDDLAKSLGGGGGGGGVSGAADKAAEKVRTLVDYVNDLNGVFNRSSDIRFGSSAAMDEITLKWIELNEQAEEYQRKIRTLTADRKLQQYWLGIAEMYGDQVRASQLRENIAKIDDDMAKAQQGASRELTGNSRAAIENRKTMRDLLGSYEDYVSALAAAGASQSEIQRVISKLNGDFTTQARHLGFNGGELVTYRKRFSDLTTIVDRMPRDITVGFDGDPALQAMKEFFAKAKEQASTAGSDIGDAMGGGIGSGLGGSLPVLDEPFIGPVFDPAFKVAEDKGKKVGGFFSESTRDFFRSFGAGIIYDGMEALFAPGGILAKEQGKIAGNGFNTEMSTALLSSDPVTQRLLMGQAAAKREAGKTGTNSATEFNAKFNSKVNPVAALNQKLNEQSWSTYNSFSNLGWNAANAFNSRFQTTVGGSKVFDFAASGRSKGFSAGGYTGPGHWLQPAGIVHRGEYVIPKRYVNQSTGLPDMNYVASLSKAKSAGPGYAMGGHVSGGGFPSMMELGPATLNYLAQALSVRLAVGSRDLANAASQGDRQLAWAGSN